MVSAIGHARSACSRARAHSAHAPRLAGSGIAKQRAAGGAASREQQEPGVVRDAPIAVSRARADGRGTDLMRMHSPHDAPAPQLSLPPAGVLMPAIGMSPTRSRALKRRADVSDRPLTRRPRFYLGPRRCSGPPTGQERWDPASRRPLKKWLSAAPASEWVAAVAGDVSAGLAGRGNAVTAVDAPVERHHGLVGRHGPV